MEKARLTPDADVYKRQILLSTLGIRDNIWLIYLFGMISSTILEYFTGDAMEKLFHVRYWDYTRHKFNLKGHICIMVSLAWGAFSILLVKVLHPPIEDLVMSIPMTAVDITAFALTIYVAVDMTVSFNEAMDLKATPVSYTHLGAISAIGPSFAVFIVMVGLMSAIGTPMSWMRLSVIGSADAELLHAGLGASAVGQNLGSDEYNAVGYIASIWAMSTLGISWLINIFLIPSANKIEAKIKHRDDKLLQVVSVSCMIGIMSYMTVQNVIVGWDMAAAAAGAISSQLCLTKLSEKKTWLKEYVLGISMIIGMAVGMAASGV